MNEDLPNIAEVYDLETLTQNLWRFAPEVLLSMAAESVRERIPTAIAIGTYKQVKYWFMLHSGQGPYIAHAIPK